MNKATVLLLIPLCLILICPRTTYSQTCDQLFQSSAGADGRQFGSRILGQVDAGVYSFTAFLNPPAFRRMLLEVFENRSAAEKSELEARPNRIMQATPIHMVYSVRPSEIQVLLEQLHLRRSPGAERVIIAPHALKTMAEIISTTRQKNAGTPELYQAHPGLTDLVQFRDPIARLRHFQLIESIRSDASAVLDAVRTIDRDLKLVARNLDEGDSGISNRDVARWLARAVEEAAAPGNDNTLTTEILLRTFQSMLAADQIFAENTQQRDRWTKFSNRVALELQYPRIKADIMSSLAELADQTDVQSWEVGRIIFETNPLGSLNSAYTAAMGRRGYNAAAIREAQAVLEHERMVQRMGRFSPK